jgi:hypothetical protein
VNALPCDGLFKSPLVQEAWPEPVRYQNIAKTVSHWHPASLRYTRGADSTTRLLKFDPVRYSYRPKIALSLA